MQPPDPPEPLSRGDFRLLIAFCLLFFGFSLIGGRPLTMHEGVLPQTAREMFVDHDWVVPKNGGRPWLESPPLPQWCTVAIATLFGHCDQVWIVRIGPACMATISVMLVASMAAGWFGRRIGLLSGLVLATVYEFTQYAWLAEDEIYLCALVTLAVAWFVRIEFFQRLSAAPGSRNFFGTRPAGLLVLFLLLGMTNLAKGLLFGTVMALVPVAGFLLWNADWRRISFYFWCWGWLAFVVIAAAWPIAACLRFPDVPDLWLFDHKGRLDGAYQAISQPIWYYLKVLPGEIAPWTIVVPFGLAMTARAAVRQRYSPERFLWCWALMTPAVFSIPSGKHHHYLLHCLAPWAVIAAIALVRLREKILAWPARLRNPLNSLATLALPGVVALWLLRAKIPGPPGFVSLLAVVWTVTVVGLSWAVAHRNIRIAGGTLFGVVACGYCVGHYCAGAFFDQCRDDTAFLLEVRRLITPDRQLVVNTQTGSLDEFRTLFYLDERTIPLHNLSFLADNRLPAEDVYVISRFRDLPEIARFGGTSVVLQSRRTRRESSPGDRWTLFHLQYTANQPRYSSRGVRVSPMQAAQRAPGPHLGPIRIAKVAPRDAGG